MTVDGNQRGFAESEVHEVARRGHASRLLGASLGAAAGAITGAVICETSDVEGRYFHSRGLTSGVYAGLGAGLGVVTALIIPQ